MAEQSKIEWTDGTWNGWIGCTRVSPACDHCYAAVATPTRTMGIEWGAGKPRHRTSEGNWKLPLRWNKKTMYECDGCGKRSEDFIDGLTYPACPDCWPKARSHNYRPTRRRVFCSSLSDWLDNEVPIEWLVDLLDLIRQTPNLDWLLLTKRIGNWQDRLIEASNYAANTLGYPGELEAFIDSWAHSKCPPENVWMGITVINQQEADRDIPKLLKVPAHIRFLSIEPMLGSVDLEIAWHGESAIEAECWGECAWCNEGHPALHNCQSGRQTEAEFNKGRSGIDWVICGGESGPHARPMHPDWARSLRDQCQDAAVAFLFKQWGEWAPNWYNDDDGNMIPGSEWMDRQGKKASGRTLDGRTHDEWPNPIN